MPLQGIDGFGVDQPRWVTARAPSSIPSLSEVVNQRLGHDGPAGVARTQHQHPDPISGHQPQQPAVFSDGSQQPGLSIVSGIQQALSAPSV